MKSLIPIAHYETKYSISSEGYIQSNWNNNKLSPRKNKNGYLVVTLEKEQLLVHRLVALHFIPNPYLYPQINHINGNKENNHYLNLEWCTAEQNAQHALKTGLRTGFIPYSIKKELMLRAISGELIQELVLDFPQTHPNTLSRMLRVTAKKENMSEEWKIAMKNRRKDAAISNIQTYNSSRNSKK